MPKDLYRQLREYFIHYQAAMSTFHERTMLKELSPCLQARVAGLANAGLIRQVPFFQNADERCITALVLCLEPHLFVPDEIICYQGEVGREMFIIKSGVVQVYLEVASGEHGDTKDFKELAVLRKGSFFGEMALLKGEGARRNAFIRTVGYAIIYSLAREDLLPVLAKYDSLRQKLEEIAMKRDFEITLAKVAENPGSEETEDEERESSFHDGVNSPVRRPSMASMASVTSLGGDTTVDGASLLRELKSLLKENEAAALTRHKKLEQEVQALQSMVSAITPQGEPGAPTI
jgi:cyclic nucleotide gated channel beta 1